MGKIASKGCCAGARNEIAEALKRRLALRKKTSRPLWTS